MGYYPELHARAEDMETYLQRNQRKPFTVETAVNYHHPFPNEDGIEDIEQPVWNPDGTEEYFSAERAVGRQPSPVLQVGKGKKRGQEDQGRTRRLPKKRKTSLVILDSQVSINLS